MGVGVDGLARGRQAGCRRVRSGRAIHAAVHHRDPCADVACTDFEALFSSARTRPRDDLDPEFDAAIFLQRLWGMFTVSYPHTLTLPQRDRVHWHLFSGVRSATQTSLAIEDAAAPPALPDLVTVMDLQQEQAARTLGEGQRVIHVGARSGKTMARISGDLHRRSASHADARRSTG